MSKITAAAEDYLKEIYTLCTHYEKASTSEIAARLGIQSASVTNMIQKLSQTEPPLVNYQKNLGVTLTEAGRKAALNIFRRHRLLEVYLYEKLNYAWDEVHEEAEKLEHVASPKMINQIAAVLGNPTHSPHGHPIPSPDLVMPIMQEMPLTDLSPSVDATIQRVRDRDANLLRYLAQHNLNLGTDITVQKKLTDGAMHILVKGEIHKPVRLTASMAQQIFVNKSPEGSELPGR